MSIVTVAGAGLRVEVVTPAEVRIGWDEAGPVVVQRADGGVFWTAGVVTGSERRFIDAKPSAVESRYRVVPVVRVSGVPVAKGSVGQKLVIAVDGGTVRFESPERRGGVAYRSVVFAMKDGKVIHNADFRAPATVDVPPGAVRLTCVAEVTAGTATPGITAVPGNLDQFAIVTVRPAVSIQSTGGRTYHVDPVAGSDDADGLTPASAWKSIDHANAMTFAADDHLLFKGGSTSDGRLVVRGAGTAGNSIVVGRYGDGPDPVIEAGGWYPEAVRIHNAQYVTVEHLALTNHGDHGSFKLNGITIIADDCGTLHDIRIDGLFVHDVLGSDVKGVGGAGISWFNGGTKPSRFDGLVIENCKLDRVDRNGIVGGSGFTDRGRWFPSLNVVVRGNHLTDIGGDGIVPIGTAGALVEHNVIVGCRTRATDPAAGIWPWSADDTVVQFNEVSGTKGTLDGQGFDADWNCRGTVIQYNYSHDNEGGFLLVCDDGSAHRPGSVGNVDAMIRFNVSRNDGINHPDARTIQLAGPIVGTRIVHNTIIQPKDATFPLVKSGEWNGRPISATFENNLFVTGGAIVSPDGPVGCRFKHNGYTTADFRPVDGDGERVDLNRWFEGEPWTVDKVRLTADSKVDRTAEAFFGTVDRHPVNPH